MQWTPCECKIGNPEDKHFVILYHPDLSTGLHESGGALRYTLSS